MRRATTRIPKKSSPSVSSSFRVCSFRVWLSASLCAINSTRTTKAEEKLFFRLLNGYLDVAIRGIAIDSLSRLCVFIFRFDRKVDLGVSDDVCPNSIG